ncbi:MAG: hypothetical protein JRI34_02280 [Deltaproteobacteria bacterium]|nr:hypothetical protein [Deltaproteobacteria bacterium]
MALDRVKDELIEEKHAKLLKKAIKRERQSKYRYRKSIQKYKDKIARLRKDLKEAKRIQRTTELKNHPVRIIERLYSKGSSPSKIARKLNVSRQAVHITIYGAASERIRAEIETILGVKVWG